MVNDIQYFRASDSEGAFVSTGYGHFRVNWLRKKRLSFENYTQIQYDQGRNMPLRLLLGGGLRYRAVDKEKSKLILGLGAMQEKERWKEPEDESVIVEKNIFKNSSYINGFVQFNDHIKLDVITYYQVGYDNEDDILRQRAIGDIVISFKISDKLAFLAQFNAQFENNPVVPINRFIYSLKNGIRWDF
jgi:hypothetical protein